eukprot:jgi/Tetstr1/440432/TSEL_028765.t1
MIAVADKHATESTWLQLEVKSILDAKMCQAAPHAEWVEVNTRLDEDCMWHTAVATIGVGGGVAAVAQVPGMVDGQGPILARGIGVDPHADGSLRKSFPLTLQMGL